MFPKKPPRKARAVFLDRDGVLIREVDLLTDIRQMRLLPGAAQALRALRRMGFVIVVVTNQPVVARGWITEKDVDRIHAVLLQRFMKKGAVIDAIYFCPHHPDANLKRYRMRCRCRKPGIGLVTKAAKELKLSLRDSFTIGDRTADILAGMRARTKTILVKTGYAGKDGKYKIKPDFTAKDLYAAVAIIKKLEKNNAK